MENTSASESIICNDQRAFIYLQFGKHIFTVHMLLVLLRHVRADHLIFKGGGRVWFLCQDFLFCLHSTTKPIICFRGSHNHFYFFLNFVDVSIGQKVNNLIFFSH